MGAPYNKLMAKCEEAAATLVSALGISGLTVNRGRTAEELTAPYCVCNAPSCGPEVVRNTGIFTVSLEIIVASQADDIANDAEHQARVAQIFDVFLSDSIATSLSAALADFYVFDVMQNGFESSTEERTLIDQMNVDMVCCASDIS